MRNYLRRRTLAFQNAYRGLVDCLAKEPHAQIHLLATIAVIALGGVLRISITHWLAIILAIGMVWVSELVNTAIERLANAISLEQNPWIGQAKDIAAASVLVASVVAATIGTLVFTKALGLI